MSTTIARPTGRPRRAAGVVATAAIARAGDHYVARPAGLGGEPAETRFRVLERAPGRTVVVGAGKAHKTQVQMMVRKLLRLPGDPSPDAADALAVDPRVIETYLGSARKAATT